MAEITRSDVPCPKCGSPVDVRAVDSIDGAYTDYKYTCINPKCDYVVWEEAIDA